MVTEVHETNKQKRQKEITSKRGGLSVPKPRTGKFQAPKGNNNNPNRERRGESEVKGYMVLYMSVTHVFLTKDIILNHH